MMEFRLSDYMAQKHTVGIVKQVVRSWISTFGRAFLIGVHIEIMWLDRKSQG
jgi:hypothetical protein